MQIKVTFQSKSDRCSNIYNSVIFIYFRKSNVIENMIVMMEKYSNQLEELVAERTAQLEDEKRKTDALLYQMLPRYIESKFASSNSMDRSTCFLVLSILPLIPCQINPDFLNIYFDIFLGVSFTEIMLCVCTVLIIHFYSGEFDFSL